MNGWKRVEFSTTTIRMTKDIRSMMALIQNEIQMSVAWAYGETKVNDGDSIHIQV